MRGEQGGDGFAVVSGSSSERFRERDESDEDVLEDDEDELDEDELDGG